MVTDKDIHPVSEEVGELVLGELLDLTDQEETAAEDTSEDANWDGMETWWLFVGDSVFATQEDR